MANLSHAITGRKVIIRVKRRLCESTEEVVASDLFRDITLRCVRELARKESPLISFFGTGTPGERDVDTLIQVLSFLTKIPLDLVPNIVQGSDLYVAGRKHLSDFVEHLYNYWRSFERYVVCDSEGDVLDKRPYRTFNETVEGLTDIIRGLYRDVQESIQGLHPRVYRQVRAGAEISAIALPYDILLPPGAYRKLDGIPVIRQVLLNPPLILEPPMNKRTGAFILVDENPMARVTIEPGEWLCYPARVGNLVILVYFHNAFFELGFSLCNLFDIADDKDLARAPDALYVFGDPGTGLDGIAEMPTVFHDDTAHGLLVAAVPNRGEFG